MSVNARAVLLVGYDKIMYTRINEKIDSHIIENLTSLSAFGSIFENFWEEPMSVNVRVVLLVGYDKTMYMRINEKIDSHIIENLTSLSAFGSILKNFWEPIVN